MSDLQQALAAFKPKTSDAEGAVRLLLSGLGPKQDANPSNHSHPSGLGQSTVPSA